MMSLNQIKGKQNLWKLLFASWIYLGFIRNTIPQFANPLYFLHDFIIILIFLKFVPRSIEIKNIIAWIFITALILIQFFNFMFEKVSIIGFAQGLNLYCFGMLLVSSVNKQESSLISLNLSKILEISMIPNLALCILQVPLKIQYFQNSQISNSPHLGSANGYIRAYGTFASTTGFTLYLTVVFAHVLANVIHYSKLKSAILQFSALAMLLMSQSRTAIVLIIVQYLILAYILYTKRIKIHNSHQENSERSFKIFRLVLVSALLLIVILPGTLSAFSSRISQASQSENSVSRILNQQFSWIKYVDYSITGDGLAARSIAIVGYENTNSQWIEKDLERILAESGLIIGLALIGYRFIWSLYLINSIKILIREREFTKVLLLPGLVATFLQGPLYGQNDTNIYGWFFLTYIVATRSTIISQKI